MLRSARLCLLLVSAVPLARPGWTQAFQGVVTMRNIRAHGADLAGDEEPTPDKILAVPLEQILAKARAGELRVEAETTVMELKGSRIRSGTTAMRGPNEVYVIADLQTGVFRSVSPSQRMYSEWTGEDLKKMMAEMKKMTGADAGAPEPAEAAPPKLEPLGTTKVSAGSRCTGYRYRDGSTIGLAWLTKDLADVANAFQRMVDFVPGADKQGGATRRAPYLRFGFPCFAQQLDTEEGGASLDYEITELVSVERRVLADDRFTVPAGFRKVTMPQMAR